MSAESSRPNVLVIVTDDHQRDALGVAGHPVVKTPCLDALAHRGARFPNTTIMGGLNPAVCAPARASLLTGADFVRSNTNASLEIPVGGHVEIPESRTTLPELFRQAGYETFVSGKWHNDLGSLKRGFEGGRTIFHGGMCDHDKVPVRDLGEIKRGEEPQIGEGFSTEIFCDSVCGFVRERKDERPFFTWLAITSPHDPRTPPEDMRALSCEDEIPLPENFLREPAFDNGHLEVRDETLAPKPLQDATLRKHLADYYGMISHQDREIGRVLDTLREQGLEENTIVVYVGDHGLGMGQHGLLGKQNQYDHSITVPWIIAGPGVSRGVVPKGLVYSLDMYATVAELAGIEISDTELESCSTMPLIKAPESAGREDAFCAYRDIQRMVRDERWKLIEYHVGGERRTELFDLENDRWETNNLSGDPAHAETLKRLRSRGVAWQAKVQDRWMSFPEE